MARWEKNTKEVEKQRRYYSDTADQYETMHVDSQDEHHIALAFLTGMIEQLNIGSVLDVGSGTGRAITYIQRRYPLLRVLGIEPVDALREVGYRAGIPRDKLVTGDGTTLAFEDGAFDLVCEFGVLHHVRRPETVVSEMMRVARKAIFISDANNFGQGSLFKRTLKRIIKGFGGWKLANYIKTGGRGYMVSKGDGVAYSYSVFNNYKLIESRCKRIHILNTLDGRIDLYGTASHIALLGIKR